MPWIEQAANRGDPRAQYVFGTALYNGDLVPADLPRAYAMMSRAAAAGLPPAIGQLQAMEPHLTPEDRARGSQIAQTLPEPPVTEMATAAPPRGPALAPDRPHARPPAAPRPPARPVQTAERPSTALADLADAIPPEGQAPRRPRPQHPAAAAERPAAPAPAAAAGGRWRIQLGAYSSDANARRAWGAVAGRLGGLRPVIVHAGAVYRLQAGPLASRAAADQACARAHVACFPVGP
jgi:hypothetical protein